MQLHLFETEEMSHVMKEIEDLKVSFGKTRRSAFREIDALKKENRELREIISAVMQITAKKKAEFVPFFGEYIEVIN